MLICVCGNLWKESSLVQFSPTSQLEAVTVPQNDVPSALLGTEEARNTAALWVISEMSWAPPGYCVRKNFLWGTGGTRVHEVNGKLTSKRLQRNTCGL